MNEEREENAEFHMFLAKREAAFKANDEVNWYEKHKLEQQRDDETLSTEATDLES